MEYPYYGLLPVFQIAWQLPKGLSGLYGKLTYAGEIIEIDKLWSYY